MSVVDRIVSMIGGASSAVVALLVDTHTVSQAVGVDIGLIVAGTIAGWHGGAYTQRARARAASSTTRTTA